MNKLLFYICLFTFSSPLVLAAKEGFQLPSTPRPPICPPFCILGCPDLRCEFGFAKLQPCDCCPVCAKGPGDRCGGPLNELGKCSDKLGLMCQEQSIDYYSKTTNTGGVCVIKDEQKVSYRTKISRGKLLENRKLHSYGEGYVDSQTDSPCIDCSVVRKCLSPESLGCPDNFIIDPCKCCPICTDGNGGPSTDNSSCLNCAAVSCASPEALGCPNDFFVDPCKCCPVCINVNNGPSGTDNSSCLNCAAVSCPSPEALGCPDDFFVDPCKCCPVCINVNNGPGTDNSPCLNCAAVSCASPEALGCPDDFFVDPCKCCPVCTNVNNGPGTDNSPCLNCAVVKCASPEALGCPDNFIFDLCRCCPVCTNSAVNILTIPG